MVSALQSLPAAGMNAAPARSVLAGNVSRPKTPSDILNLSVGKPRSAGQVLDLVRERAYEQLRGVVNDARAALGIPEGAVIDTSPEATADRIVNFALSFFSKYAENNGLSDDEEGRRQFATFIGGAIAQGIQEARDILQGLQALTPGADNLIENTASIIQQRLEDFIANGL
ncbi:MAG TPA: DUF5610 domain-containing protein [Candidatus Hydrogenedentes bacterium]|nr:DUF5610 domain-containing protein [Candidatus Hydrogenedentota bacterium]HNT88958.1 DUF5610 domain-containing protein [Candidatus Hydrogenedentota bacterium]